MALGQGNLSIHDNNVSGFTAGAKSELSGLMRVGQVTTATSATEFASVDLIGQDDDAFDGWYVSVLQADNAAPEGEMKPITDYVSATGTITHTDFAVANDLEVGDWVVLLRPEIAMLGKVNTAAAAGAVTSDDFLMAYVKQIINELNGGSWTNLDNASISDLDGAVQKLAKVLACDGANQFSASIDGSARTELEAALVNLAVITGARADGIPTMTAAPGTMAMVPLLKAILERIGVTPADPDDSLHTVVGQRDGTIPAMNAAIDNTSTLAMNIRAIMERLGATPADSDDPLHLILGQRDDAAATGAVGTKAAIPYLKQLVNIYQLADPDLDPSVLDDSPFAQLLAKDGDVSDYNDNTDSLEALGAEVNLLKSAADGAGVFPASVQDDSILAKILASDDPATAASFSNTTDSLEAIRDRIDTLETARSTNKGLPQTFEKAVASAANAADTTLATIASGAVVVTKVVVFAVAAQTGDMTNATVKGGAAKALTFIAAADLVQADVDAEDKQVSWSGEMRLNTGDTILMEHTGTGATALNLVVAFTFHASSADGATMS